MTRRTAQTLGLAIAMAALAACNSVVPLAIPQPRGASLHQVVPTSVLLDHEPETAVAGTPTTTAVQVSPGSAVINGTVLGPGGPVQGATVEAERLVGDSEALTEATTAADGSFTINGILGGRYRVRAWRAPTLTLTNPVVFFLADTDTKTLSMQMTAFQGLQITSALNPTAPFTGQPVSLAVQVSEPTVGAQGAVAQIPQAGVAVSVEAPGFAVLDGTNGESTTDASGKALFTLSCIADGPAPISVTAGFTATVTLPAAQCVDPLTTSTTSTSLPGPTGLLTPTPTRSTSPTSFAVSPATPPPASTPGH